MLDDERANQNAQAFNKSEINFIRAAEGISDQVLVIIKIFPKVSLTLH